jgi:hypothetical protein
MKDVTIDKRINIKKFDEKTIKSVSSEIVKALSAVAKADPESEGKFHMKIGHIKLGFSKSGHIEVIIGGEPDSPNG